MYMYLYPRAFLTHETFKVYPLQYVCHIYAVTCCEIELYMELSGLDLGCMLGVFREPFGVIYYIIGPLQVNVWASINTCISSLLKCLWDLQQ